MIVTIDGPAGAGKSHVTRALAERLGFRFLDTGATYRAVALAAMQRGVSWDDADGLSALSKAVSIEFNDQRVQLDGQDVTDAIRTSEVTSVIHFVADHPGVRSNLVALQRKIAGDDNFVTEGRDQGTVAFPHAECKIFLTASSEERARRRWLDMQSRGETVSLDEILSQQNDRDHRDATRPVGALIQAADAMEVLTDGMTLDEVVTKLEEIVRDKQQALGTTGSH